MLSHRRRAGTGKRKLVAVEGLESRQLLSATYHLTFDDEFNSLDTAKWKTTDYWGNRTLSGNGEQEWYSDTASNGYNPFSVSNGVLSITAQPTPAGVNSNGLPYVSGELTTAQHYYQQYGYFELRAQMPAGKGLWPAFWMLPSNGSWPPEYDIFEVLGNNTSNVYQTSHWKGSAGDHRSAGANYSGQINSATDFHTYGFEWDASEVKWYVDGVLTQTQVNRVNMPMYALINLAVGGYWPGNPDATTLFPANMQLDYARFYSTDPNVSEVTPQSGYALSANLPVNVGSYVAPAQPAATLPSGWTSNDIGSPALSGASGYYKTATYTLRSGGYDVDGTSDQFLFASKSFVGDGYIRAKVQGISNTSAGAKAGVMFRASTAADSAFVGLFLTTGHQLALEYRTATGTAAITTLITGKEDPIWLRITRSGDTYSAAYSADGSAWTTAGSASVALGATAKTGLAATSHDTAQLGLATFSDVLTYQSIPTAPTNLVLSTNANNKIVLNWQDNSNNETYFRIQRSTDGTNFTDLTSTVTNVATYTDASVVAGTLYYYRVRAANPSGTSAFTNTASLSAPGGTVNTPPTIAAPPTGSPNPVTGKTTTLSVLGADDGGEANLTYTWSATGPAPATYSANGTNAAESTTATFSQAGSYNFTVTIKDSQGLTTTASVAVTVNSTLTSIAVSPASASVNTNATAQFSATAYDQFGTALASQPTKTWSVAVGGGSISATGLYTAPATAGSATVKAAVGAISGSAAVTVVAPNLPVVYQAESATLGGGAKVATNYSGYTGTGFVDMPKKNGTIQWNVSAAAAGTYTLAFRYALSSGSRNVSLKINGVAYSGGLTFNSTGGFSKWATVSVTVTLNAGANAILLTTTGQDSGNLDSLTVTPA